LQKLLTLQDEATAEGNGERERHDWGSSGSNTWLV